MREKWTISRLNDETLLDRRTIKKILGDTSPIDSDGKSEFFYLADFLEAWRRHLTESHDAESLNLTMEQARLTKVNREKAEVQLAKLRHTVIDVESVFRVWENIGVAIRRTILTSALSDKEKDHILNELQSLNIDALVEQQEFDEGTQQPKEKEAA
jgi:phage terminase Nu1 subunit (DNA packaging protein)